jgi:hypothetical protein
LHKTDTADIGPISLDMNSVTRTALGLRAWRLEFDSEGVPFVWEGLAANQGAAESMARRELADQWAGFNRILARVTACLEQ